MTRDELRELQLDVHRRFGATILSDDGEFVRVSGVLGQHSFVVGADLSLIHDPRFGERILALVAERTHDGEREMPVRVEIVTPADCEPAADEMLRALNLHRSKLVDIYVAA